MSKKITIDGLIRALTKYKERYGDKTGAYEVAVNVEGKAGHLHYYVDSTFEILCNRSGGAFILQAFNPEPEPEVQTFVKPVELIIREDLTTDPLNRYGNIGWKTTMLPAGHLVGAPWGLWALPYSRDSFDESIRMMDFTEEQLIEWGEAIADMRQAYYTPDGKCSEKHPGSNWMVKVRTAKDLNND